MEYACIVLSLFIPFQKRVRIQTFANLLYLTIICKIFYTNTIESSIQKKQYVLNNGTAATSAS